MKNFFLVIILVAVSACASYHKCDDEKCAKEKQQERQHLYEPAGSWRR